MSIPEHDSVGIFLGLTQESFNQLRNVIHTALPKVKDIISSEAVDRISVGPRLPGFTITPASRLKSALGEDPVVAQKTLRSLMVGLGTLANSYTEFTVKLGIVRTSRGLVRPVKHPTRPDGRPPARANITVMVDPYDTAGLGRLSRIGAGIGSVLSRCRLPSGLARTDADHMALLEYDRMRGGPLSDNARDAVANAVAGVIREFGLTTVTVGTIVLGANALHPVVDSEDRLAVWPLARP